MSKNIVICSDGTGNTAMKGRGTNVFKLYEAVDIQGHKPTPVLLTPCPPPPPTISKLTRQIAFYDDGVGTSGRPLEQIFGPAFGWGFSRNVRKLYKELMHVYKPGDKIFLFGFSRGAYTVRTLAGFIGKCGLLNEQSLTFNLYDLGHLDDKIEALFDDYQARHFVQKNERFADNKSAEDQSNEFGIEYFRNRFNLDLQEVPIEFIGVWDTVAAIGAPITEIAHWFSCWFKDQKLGSHVEHAYQALAIDDERLTFHPELWDELTRDSKTDPWKHDDRIEQVWFAGVHSNIGGGYEKQGMSLEALDWMMDKAKRHGLRFLDAPQDYVSTERDVQGTLYDSRSGTGMYYRWEPRDIAKMYDTLYQGKLSGMTPSEQEKFKPKIHISVFERIAQTTEDYAPGNIPFKCKPVSQHVWPGEAVLGAIKNALEIAGNNPPFNGSCTSALQTMADSIQHRKLAYTWFLVISVMALGAVIYGCWPKVLITCLIITIALLIVAFRVYRSMQEKQCGFISCLNLGGSAALAVVVPLLYPIIPWLCMILGLVVPGVILWIIRGKIVDKLKCQYATLWLKKSSLGWLLWKIRGKIVHKLNCHYTTLWLKKSSMTTLSLKDIFISLGL